MLRVYKYLILLGLFALSSQVFASDSTNNDESSLRGRNLSPLLQKSDNNNENNNVFGTQRLSTSLPNQQAQEKQQPEVLSPTATVISATIEMAPLTSSLRTVATIGSIADNVVSGLGIIPPSTFDADPINANYSRGFISGMFTGATVEDYGYHYKVTLNMQHFPAQGAPITQTFTGVILNPVVDTSFALASSTDDRNILHFDYDADDVSGLCNARCFQTALRAALNIGDNLTGASILSWSTALNGGVTAITASSTTPAGEYQLEYFPGVNIMKVTNGAKKYEKVITAGGTQTISFKNGISVTTDDSFALDICVPQIGFYVAMYPEGMISQTRWLQEGLLRLLES